MAVFDSNCPLYFDISERDMFAHWLKHQADSRAEYKSPTYANAIYDEYVVIENEDAMIVGCGGFYVNQTETEARLAWGMIHSDFHGQGYGTALYEQRKHCIQAKWPGISICLGTSQHTFPFYEKMGFRVVSFEKSGYGAEIDKYEMEAGK